MAKGIKTIKETENMELWLDEDGKLYTLCMMNKGVTILLDEEELAEIRDIFK